jgi:hypothetical protein
MFEEWKSRTGMPGLTHKSSPWELACEPHLHLQIPGSFNIPEISAPLILFVIKNSPNPASRRPALTRTPWLM